MKMRYTYLKGQGVKEGSLTRGTYALAEEESGLNSNTSFSFSLNETRLLNIESISFVFGFSGVGRHYRLEVNFQLSAVTLFLIRDGIKVYLHHARCPFNLDTRFELIWLTFFIELRLDGFPILRVFDNELKSGRWGFFAEKSEIEIPTVKIDEGIQPKFDWVCFGDGFSNARWRERDFMSWPELVFREPFECCNLAVAAGNSRRMVEIINDIPDGISENFILAVGNDDLIEGAEFDSLAENLQRGLSHFQKVNRVFVCSLTPRRKSLDCIRNWNQKLKDFVQIQKKWEFLDISEILVTYFDSAISHGEFPNELGQKLIAQEIAKILGLEHKIGHLGSSPLKKKADHSSMKQFLLRALLSVNVRLSRFIRTLE